MPPPVGRNRYFTTGNRKTTRDVQKAAKEKQKKEGWTYNNALQWVRALDEDCGFTSKCEKPGIFERKILNVTKLVCTHHSRMIDDANRFKR